MASKPGTKQSAAAANQEFDPKYEWQENAADYVLRVHLSGFRKEDFRVQVDGAGRLTVRGQRAEGAKQIRFHRVFQLPPTSNLDGISGRFDAGVLSLTVPKRPAPPPATVEEIIKPAKEAGEAKPKEETKPKEEAKPKETAKPKEEEEAKKAETKTPPQVQAEKPRKDEAKKAEQQHKEEINKPPKEKKAEQHKEETKKPIEKKAADVQQTKEVVDAKGSKPEQEQKTAPPAVRKEEENKAAKAEAAAAAAPAEAKPPQAKVVDRESLLERVRRRAEEERAKAAAAAEEAERQRKQSACCGWKERVTGDLQGLANSEWAEGVVDTVKKNKEVIATAVAAFSLGLFASRLFSRN